MMTKKEILGQLKNSNVSLGKNPERTFVYYQEMELVPKGKTFLSTNKRVALFPDWVPTLIKNIKKYQREGKKLSEIKKALDESRRMRKELKEALGLQDEKEEPSFQTSLIREEEMHYLISAFYPDKIKFFKVDRIVDPFHITKDLQVLEQKTLNLEEYAELVKRLAIKLAKEKHKILRDQDIKLSIFS